MREALLASFDGSRAFIFPKRFLERDSVATVDRMRRESATPAPG